MKTSEQINEISAALAKAQGQMKNPEKNRTATIKMKAGGEFSYNYADLPSTFDTARAALSENGLAHVCSTMFVEGRYTLFGRLTHSSGQWFEAEWPLGAPSDPKTMAANITYGTRYLFNCLVGISGDDDVEDVPEEGAKYEPKEKVKMQEPAKPVIPLTITAGGEIQVAQPQSQSQSQSQKKITVTEVVNKQKRPVCPKCGGDNHSPVLKLSKAGDSYYCPEMPKDKEKKFFHGYRKVSKDENQDPPGFVDWTKNQPPPSFDSDEEVPF